MDEPNSVRKAMRRKLRREQDREVARIGLAAKLLEGLASGKAIAFTEDLFKRKKIALVKQMGRIA